VTGKVAGSQQSTIKIPVMPYISYHTVTETQQQLKVIIEYKVSIDKGMTEYEGIISCSLKAPSKRRSTTSHYGFSFMRDHSWRYVGGMEIFECSENHRDMTRYRYYRRCCTWLRFMNRKIIKWENPPLPLCSLPHLA
jgi:hypothetical protein